MSHSAANYNIYGLHHVQIAIPAGSETTARRFYCDLLGFSELDRPAVLAGRGGLWLRSGDCILHLGIETEFRPARKAHPALLVRDLAAMKNRLHEAGAETSQDVAFDGMDRLHVADPFGNRIELVQLLDDLA